jgi:hypothetical protein
MVTRAVGVTIVTERSIHAVDRPSAPKPQTLRVPENTDAWECSNVSDTEARKTATG